MRRQNIVVRTLQDAKECGLEDGLFDMAGNSIAPGAFVAYNRAGNMTLGTVESVTLSAKHIPITAGYWTPVNKNFKSAIVRNKFTKDLTTVHTWYTIFALKGDNYARFSPRRKGQPND